MNFSRLRERIPGSDSAWLLAWRASVLGLVLAILFAVRSSADNVDDLASNLDDLKEKVGEVEEKINDVEGKVDSVEGQATDVAYAVEEIKETVSVLDRNPAVSSARGRIVSGCIPPPPPGFKLEDPNVKLCPEKP